MTNAESPMPLTVEITPELAQRIDEWHSPTDGAIAISQLIRELPFVHRPIRTLLDRVLGKTHLRQYQGRFEWTDLGFTYIQIGSELHVLSCWQANDDAVDTVLPTPRSAGQR